MTPEAASTAPLTEAERLSRLSAEACEEAGLSSRWCETLGPILERHLAAHVESYQAALGRVEALAEAHTCAQPDICAANGACRGPIEVADLRAALALAPTPPSGEES